MSAPYRPIRHDVVDYRSVRYDKPLPPLKTYDGIFKAPIRHAPTPSMLPIPDTRPEFVADDEDDNPDQITFIPHVTRPKPITRVHDTFPEAFPDMEDDRKREFEGMGFDDNFVYPQIFMPIQLGGTIADVQAILDTGATSGLAPHELLAYAHNVQLDPSAGDTAGGRITTSRTGYLTLRVGDTWQELPFHFLDQDGQRDSILIGSDSIRTINLRNRTATINNIPFHYTTIGLDNSHDLLMPHDEAHVSNPLPRVGPDRYGFAREEPSYRYVEDEKVRALTMETTPDYEIPQWETPDFEENLDAMFPRNYLPLYDRFGNEVEEEFDEDGNRIIPDLDVGNGPYYDDLTGRELTEADEEEFAVPTAFEPVFDNEGNMIEVYYDRDRNVILPDFEDDQGPYTNADGDVITDKNWTKILPIYRVIRDRFENEVPLAFDKEGYRIFPEDIDPGNGPYYDAEGDEVAPENEHVFTTPGMTIRDFPQFSEAYNHLSQLLTDTLVNSRFRTFINVPDDYSRDSLDRLLADPSMTLLRAYVTPLEEAFAALKTTDIKDRVAMQEAMETIVDLVNNESREFSRWVGLTYFPTTDDEEDLLEAMQAAGWEVDELPPQFLYYIFDELFEDEINDLEVIMSYLYYEYYVRPRLVEANSDLDTRYTADYFTNTLPGIATPDLGTPWARIAQNDAIQRYFSENKQEEKISADERPFQWDVIHRPLTLEDYQQRTVNEKDLATLLRTGFANMGTISEPLGRLLSGYVDYGEGGIEIPQDAIPYLLAMMTNTMPGLLEALRARGTLNPDVVADAIEFFAPLLKAMESPDLIHGQDAKVVYHEEYLRYALAHLRTGHVDIDWTKPFIEFPERVRSAGEINRTLRQRLAGNPVMALVNPQLSLILDAIEEDTDPARAQANQDFITRFEAMEPVVENDPTHNREGWSNSEVAEHLRDALFNAYYEGRTHNPAERLQELIRSVRQGLVSPDARTRADIMHGLTALSADFPQVAERFGVRWQDTEILATGGPDDWRPFIVDVGNRLDRLAFLQGGNNPDHHPDIERVCYELHDRHTDLSQVALHPLVTAQDAFDVKLDVPVAASLQHNAGWTTGRIPGIFQQARANRDLSQGVPPVIDDVLEDARLRIAHPDTDALNDIRHRMRGLDREPIAPGQEDAWMQRISAYDRPNPQDMDTMVRWLRAKYGGLGHTKHMASAFDTYLDTGTLNLDNIEAAEFAAFIRESPEYRATFTALYGAGPTRYQASNFLKYITAMSQTRFTQAVLMAVVPEPPLDPIQESKELDEIYRRYAHILPYIEARNAGGAVDPPQEAIAIEFVHAMNGRTFPARGQSASTPQPPSRGRRRPGAEVAALAMPPPDALARLNQDLAAFSRGMLNDAMMNRSTAGNLALEAAGLAVPTPEGVVPIEEAKYRFVPESNIAFHGSMPVAVPPTQANLANAIDQPATGIQGPRVGFAQPALYLIPPNLPQVNAVGAHPNRSGVVPLAYQPVIALNANPLPPQVGGAHAGGGAAFVPVPPETINEGWQLPGVGIPLGYAPPSKRRKPLAERTGPELSSVFTEAERRRLFPELYQSASRFTRDFLNRRIPVSFGK